MHSTIQSLILSHTCMYISIDTLIIIPLNKMSIFNEHYVYQSYSYINHYSCTIYFYNKDRGASFCCGVSISNCFAQLYICMFSNYITTYGPGSIIIGPPYDMYTTKIIYSPIIHRLPAFPNINSGVELFNSLSDEHRVSPSILPIPFILTHALFPIYSCVLFKNWWKPVADISIALITCTKLFTQVHTVYLTVYITQNTCNPTISERNISKFTQTNNI